jgi:hypothetical protein
MVLRPSVGEGSKAFFFEKKKQKTFTHDRQHPRFRVNPPARSKS